MSAIHDLLVVRDQELAQLRAEIERLMVFKNLLRDAVSWFDAWNVGEKIGLPQWQFSAREVLGRNPGDLTSQAKKPNDVK